MTSEANQTGVMEGVHDLACMEVWGGSRAFDGRVSVPGHDVHVWSVPHEQSERGGDIYYLSNCAAGLITRFVLADVSGHGEQVAEIARALRALMRRHINTADQTRFAVALNGELSSLGIAGRFATALLLTYFAPTDHMIVCNAGHPRPLIHRASYQGWELLDSRSPGGRNTTERGPGAIGIANLPLGILDPTDYEQFAVRLEEGDVLVLYTDALIEARDRDGKELGEEGLLDLVKGCSMGMENDLGEAIRQRVAVRTGREALDDDATVIVLRHNAADPPRLGLLGQVHRMAGALGLRSIDSGPGWEG